MPGAITAQHVLIGGRRDQNVAVGENKIVVADKFPGDFRGFAGAVLHRLAAKGDLDVPFLAVAEIVFDDFAAKAGDDEEMAQAGGNQAGENVFQDRFALDAEHGFGQFGGQPAHARSFAGR